MDGPDITYVEGVKTQGARELRIRLRGRLGGPELFIRATAPLDTSSLTCWLPALVPPAMRARSPLVLAGVVDRTALHGQQDAQRLLASWYPDLRHVPVTSDSHGTTTGRSEGIACFFTGGVDSFYSVLRHQRRITHLIYAHGFDVRLDQPELAERVTAALNACAWELGAQLILVTTNLRDFSDRYVSWGSHYHGAALATIALALSPVIGTAIVPGSFSEEGLHPWGSHPELDPLWGSSSLEVLHDAIDVTRTQKVRSISSNSTAMRHLRVCWENPQGAYNCGRCEKCLRTMINLYACGALDRCSTLPHTIEPEALRAIVPLSDGDQVFLRENLAALAKAPRRDRHLESELRHALSRAKLSRTRSFLRGWISRLTPSPIKTALRRIRR
jgi:hypothetical protein